MYVLQVHLNAVNIQEIRTKKSKQTKKKNLVYVQFKISSLIDTFL